MCKCGLYILSWTFIPSFIRYEVVYVWGLMLKTVARLNEQFLSFIAYNMDRYRSKAILHLIRIQVIMSYVNFISLAKCSMLSFTEGNVDAFRS